MANKLNPILVNVMLALTCSLLLLWAHSAYPSLIGALVDKVGNILSYPEHPAQEIRNVVHSAHNWMIERRSLQERNTELEVENLALRTSLQRLGVPAPAATQTLIGARVTLRYPDAWWKEVRVDRGTKDGINLGAPALAEGFLIGRVVRVGADYAWIELVTSTSFLLAAVVNETWDLGVVNGDDSGGVWLLYMPPEKIFQEGLLVSTALVGDYLPPGIPIGRILGAGDPRDGFTPQRIASGAALTQLYNVQILSSGGASRTSGTKGATPAGRLEG